ncbi:hypothetical protein BD779DRAFT_678091 [Infundibulicybe gibba]|nr:hypothetical protein BD779DRAFT_678091 [Infundibulicybe gibba]
MAVHLSYRPSTPAPSALPNPLRRSARLVPPTNSAPVSAPAAHPTTPCNRPPTPQSNPRKRQRIAPASPLPLPSPVELCRHPRPRHYCPRLALCVPRSGSESASIMPHPHRHRLPRPPEPSVSASGRFS